MQHDNCEQPGSKLSFKKNHRTHSPVSTFETFNSGHLACSCRADLNMDAAALAKAKSDERRAHLEAFRATQAAKRAASLGQKPAEPATIPAKAAVSR